MSAHVLMNVFELGANSMQSIFNQHAIGGNRLVHLHHISTLVGLDGEPVGVKTRPAILEGFAVQRGRPRVLEDGL